MQQVQLASRKNQGGKSKSESTCKGGFMSLKEDDIVMCTVKSIEGAIVFLYIEDNGEGSMPLSEVAAGRIRNLREYISPNKKIVCKILHIAHDGHIQLSLRRVTGKERESMQKLYKKEKNFLNMLKATCENPKASIAKIKESYSLEEFFDLARENPSLLSQFFPPEEVKKITKLLTEKKDKEKIVKREIILKTNSENGIEDIKHILSHASQLIEIRYLGSSRFSLISKAKDFKDANHSLLSVLGEIEKISKERHAHLEIKEK